MANVWDDPAVRKAGAANTFMKFTDIGDSWKGTVAAVGKHTWNDGSIAVKITAAEEDVATVTASQVLLMQALWELKPVQGDVLSIRLGAIESSANRTLKRFVVSVVRPDGTVDTVDQTL